jgi:agmatinase/guanidinopropionase
MSNFQDIIKNPALWAGLNKPDISMEDCDVAVFGIPFDGGVSFRSGAKTAPDALRNITYTISPTTEDFQDFSDLKVKDMGNALGNTRDELFESAEEMAYKAVKAGKFFTMIGGDHSTTIPVHRGIDKALDQSFGIIHIDAHFDLCNDQSGDTLSHATTERRALELDNVDGIDNLFFLGIRSIESDELAFFTNNKVNVLSAKEISKIGADAVIAQVKEKMKDLKHVYITLDIDCLDPAYAAGTGTPQFGGMTSRELLNILEGLFQLPVIGMDVVEVAPNLDPSLSSLFAARKIVTECWWHHFKKSK